MRKVLFNSLFLVLGAILMASAWQPFNFILGVFVGLFPLFYVENKINAQKVSLLNTFGYAYVFFASFIFLVIWWVQYAHWLGVIASVVVNGLFFAGIFTLYVFVKQYLPSKIATLSFVCFFIAWEYIELVDWDLSWPWMTLGHALADYPLLIQWYSITGSLGGSLWIVIINVLLWKTILYYRTQNSLYKQRLYWLIGGLVLPIVFSVIAYFSYTVATETQTVVAVQPNVDPYTEKFITASGQEQYLSPSQQVQILKSLAQEKLNTKKVAAVLFPETAIPVSIWKHEMENHALLDQLKLWTRENEVYLITGIHYAADVEVENPEDLAPDIKKRKGIESYYKRYNSALWIAPEGIQDLYHKSRLVIGVERIPSYFVFLQRYMQKFQDDVYESEYNPNNGTQDFRAVFYTKDSALALAPIICYESIFGDFVRGYVNNGANVLAVITNDAWWGNTPGYKQHFAYARLRAIENRRSVVRSANTGWSGLINARGDVVQKSQWWQPDALLLEVPIETTFTTYTKYGDVLGRIAVPLSLLFLINALIKRKKSKSALGRLR